MGETVQSSTEASYVEAFTKVRSGALLMIIGTVLVVLGVFPLVLLSFAMFPAPGPGPFGRFEAGLAFALAMVAVLIVGAVVSLVGMYGRFIPGASRLAELNPEFSTAATLIKIGYLVGLILLIIGALTLIIIVGFFILIVGGILLFIGFIGLIILCFKLHDLEKDTLYLVAGILFIIGIFVGITSFIGWILIYVALRHSISRRTAPPTIAPTIAQPL